MEGLTPAGDKLPRMAYAGSLDSESANHYEFPRRPLLGNQVNRGNPPLAIRHELIILRMPCHMFQNLRVW
jgi:hypothetical protein